jgi:hypothetical protein
MHSTAPAPAHPDAAPSAPVLRNPVLPGFHPDPSILRVGDDYYLATSTFEWYPGVRLHHSRDLVHWRALGGVLTGTRLLDMAGVPDSGGTSSRESDSPARAAVRGAVTGEATGGVGAIPPMESGLNPNPVSLTAPVV